MKLHRCFLPIFATFACLSPLVAGAQVDGAEKICPEPDAAPGLDAPETDDPDCRIVNGEIAGPGTIAWQIQIFARTDYTESDFVEDDGLRAGDRKYLRKRAVWDTRHRCGGAYIGDRWILTAAHCVNITPIVKGRTSNFVGERLVRMGTQSIAVANDNYVFKVSTAVIHSGWRRGKPGVGRKLDDIALIRIVDNGHLSELLASGRVRAVRPLPKMQPALPLMADLLVSGWGRMDVSDGVLRRVQIDRSGRVLWNSAPLRQLVIKNLASSVCAVHPPFQREKFNGDTQICAGSLRRAADSCQNDSGGPLVWTDSGTDWLVGIVSFGDGCAKLEVPAIYTRVSAYESWVAAAKKFRPGTHFLAAQ